MKKISYRNKDRYEKLIKTNELPSVGNSDSSTESGGRTGYLFTGLPDTHELSDDKMTESDAFKLVNNFINLADDFDKENLLGEANFIDFLIKKIGSSNKISEEERYIEYIYKIYISDFNNSIKKVQQLTEAYSKEISLSLKNGIGKESAKNIAFSKKLLRNFKNE